MLEGSSSATEARRFGRYEVLGKLASGGMATVYIGRRLGVGDFSRVVAVKVCHPHLLPDESFRSMFLEEARLAARIHHPNVASTLDISDDDGLYIVMEYVEGGRLADLISEVVRAGSAIPIPIVLRILCDALSGLHAAHETRDASGDPLQIVHRDVSPQNIMVGVDGLSRVVDFGVAKAASRLTVSEGTEVKGKLGYMPPEQLSGATVTRRSDIFSAGVVLWEALVGKRLFRGDSRAETMSRVLRCVVPTASRTREDIPRSLDQVLACALARDPADRYGSAEAFADDLERTGVKLASHREVGAYVREKLNQGLKARREQIQEWEALTRVDRSFAAVESSGKRPARRFAPLLGVAAIAAAVAWSISAWNAHMSTADSSAAGDETAQGAATLPAAAPNEIASPADTDAEGSPSAIGAATPEPPANRSAKMAQEASSLAAQTRIANESPPVDDSRAPRKATMRVSPRRARRHTTMQPQNSMRTTMNEYDPNEI